MPKQVTDAFLAALHQEMANRTLVLFDRGPKSKENLHGFVVGVGQRLFLLHVVSDGLLLDGYMAVPVESCRRFRTLDDCRGFSAKALALRHQKPVRRPDILLDSYVDLFHSLAARGHLITIERENIDATVCHIGLITKVTKTNVSLRLIDPSARWGRVTRFRFSDITRVEFGGVYESALWLVSCSESGNKAALRRAIREDRKLGPGRQR